MNLLILFTGGDGFPLGGAYTNRVLSLSKGLVLNGCKVTILIMYPGKNNTSEPEGIFDGIYYKFASATVRPKSPIRKTVTGIKGIINGIRYIISSGKQVKYDAILSFSASFSQNLSVFLISRIKKVSFIREKNEFPQIILKKGFDDLNFFNRIYLNHAYKIFDGYIFISASLKKFFEGKTRKRSLVEIVPIVVDNERFNNGYNLNPEKWITYCGHLYGEKDGVLVLLEAFSLISGKFPDYKLLLIGDTSNEVPFSLLNQVVKNFKIENKVEFTGYIGRDKIPDFLQKSAVLVLARPDNVQAKGGFPTKLGEYLATGRPVLVTKVSDIPAYIKHRQNGFLAKPGSAADFAEKLEEILSDYDHAAQVGLEGKRLTDTYFNNIYQAKRIIEFIDRVKNQKQ